MIPEQIAEATIEECARRIEGATVFTQAEKLLAFAVADYLRNNRTMIVRAVTMGDQE